MKKTIYIIILLISVLSLTGCIYTLYSSTVPEKLGKWDNNYIYYENKISKTTGEDEELLFDSITYNEILYSDIYVMDHVFMDNILYASVRTKDECYSIVKYDIKTDELTVLYLSNEVEFYSLIDYNVDYLIFHGEDLIKLDLKTNATYILHGVGEYTLYDEYILCESGNGYIYLFNHNTNEKTLVSEALNTTETYTTNYKLIDICNRPAILIKRCASPYRLVDSSDSSVFRLEIYDIQTNTLSIIKEFDVGFQINMISSEYLTIGKFNEIEHSDNGYRKYDFVQENKLYKIEYDDGFKLKFLYEFDKQYNCTEAYVDNNNIRFKLKYLEVVNERGELKCKYKKVKYSLKNNELKSAVIFNDKYVKLTFNDEYKEKTNNSEYVKTTLDFECNGYTYYFKQEYHSLIFASYSSCYLYREKGLKTDVMQFYSDYYEYETENFITSSFITSCARENDPNKIIITDFKK